MSPRRFLALVAAMLVFGSRSEGLQSSSNSVVAGDFLVEPPTLISLGFEWKIQGDENRNATVAVQYRKKGESAWRDGLPMLRTGDEKVWRAREHLEFWTPRMFAGSILDLEPRSTYECRFTLSDPDGVSGQAVREVTVSTRGSRRSTRGVARCIPPDYTGPKQEPAFSGLKEAYYGPGTGDWSVFGPQA